MGRRLQTYATEQVTVTYNPGTCIHAAECVRRLPLVFDTSRKRWIQPDLATVDEVVEVVRRCPTGALQYVLPSGEREQGDESPTIRATRHGPLYLRGDVTLVTESGEVVATGTRVALCRCGASKSKPHCDGSHLGIGFDAE